MFSVALNKTFPSFFCRATFWPTKFKSHYVAPQFFIYRQNRPNCAHIFLQWNAHIFLFWLNPTGHSKFHNTSNHPPPAIDSGRTTRTPFYQPATSVLPPPPLTPSTTPFFPCPGQRNRRRPVPVPVTGMRYNRLIWMCTLNTDLPWPSFVINHETVITRWFSKCLLKKE